MKYIEVNNVLTLQKLLTTIMPSRGARHWRCTAVRAALNWNTHRQRGIVAYLARTAYSGWGTCKQGEPCKDGSSNVQIGSIFRSLS